jgi:hypothetical protein
MKEIPMRRLTLVLVALALFGSLGAAQPHQDGLFASGLSHVYYLSAAGKLTSAWMPGIHMAATMHHDNRTVLIHDFLKSAILKMDPKTLAVVGTHVTHKALGNSFAVQSLDIDHNGDVYFTATQPMRGVFRVNAVTGALTSVVTAANTGQVFGNVTDLRVDIDSGDLIVGDLNATAGRPFYRVKRDGSSYTTVATGWDLFFGLDKHVLTGDLFAAASAGSTLATGRSLQVLRRGQTTVQTWLNHPVLRSAWGPVFDRASAAKQRLFSGAWEDRNTPGSSGIWRIELSTGAPTKIGTLTNGGFANVYHVVPVYRRNLQTVRRAIGVWDLFLNCPGQGNRRYVIGASVSGIRPGVKLADGRRIPLVPDTVTMLAVNGWLGKWLTPGPGVLKNGFAQGSMDLRLLLPAAQGVPVWLCAVVLDPNAPQGISLITDPLCFVIEL